ncbi:MAG: hypothetical protein ACI8Z1_003314 [Candidatus Azotimanducaceae bacterium]|jgi:hypothetical protein
MSLVARAFSDLKRIQVKGRKVALGKMLTDLGLPIRPLINEHHLSTVIETRGHAKSHFLEQSNAVVRETG